MNDETIADESGIRHRFRVIFRDHHPNHYPAEMERLLAWCKIFDEDGLAPVEGGASAGNLSFRTPGGFVITPTRSQLKSGLSWRHLVEIVRADWLAYEVHVLGERAPSSDTFLHERIYALRPDVAAVFHGHDGLILRHGAILAKEDPSLKLTECARAFGTKEDAMETARDLGSADAIIRLGHGFVTVGRTQEHAGERARSLRRRAVASSQS